MARARNLSDGDAADVLAHERPDIYQEYRASLGLGDARERERSKNASKPSKRVFVDEFMIQGAALSDALDIPLEAAYDQLVRSSPALYERYRAKLFGRDLDRETVAAVQARTESSEFMTLAKSIAAQRNVHIVDAFVIAARQAPELYDEYHSSL